jgi:hypothetical protein
MHIATHNGTWTVTSVATGERRTFQIKTWVKKDDKPRVVSMLIGSDNTSDYKGFGFVNSDGKIVVWKKDRGTVFEKYARMLETLQEHVDAGRVVIHHEGRCRICNKPLTVPESIESGIGPKCASK